MKKNLVLVITLCMAVIVCMGVFAYLLKENTSKRGSAEPRLFGATYMTRNNPFFEELHEGIKEVVEENGDILIARDPQQNQERQNQQILDMLDEGIEVLFLNPVDWESVFPALEACKAANVPVINVDTVVKDTEYVVSIIETDNYQAGVECAKDLINRLPNRRDSHH